MPILLERLARHPEDSSLYAYLMDCYFNLKQYAQAIEYAQMVLLKDVSALEYQSRIYRRWIKALQYENRQPEEIETVIKEAIRRFPDMPDFYCEYALFLIEAGKYETALKNLEIADAKEKDYKGEEPSFYKFLYLTKEKLQAALYADRKDCMKALSHYANVLKNSKFDARVFRDAYGVLQSVDPLRVIEFFNGIYDLCHLDNLNFLIDNIGKYSKNKVLAYYIHARKKAGAENKEPDLILGLCSIGKFEAAAVQLYKILCYKAKTENYFQQSVSERELFAACLIAMNNVPPRPCLDCLSKEEQGVIECFYDEPKEFTPNLTKPFWKLVEFERLLKRLI